MNLDQTVNPNGDVDYNQIDENALRFILTLQSLTTVPEVWELFLRTIGQVFPEPLEEAHLAYKAGVLARALIARPVPGDDNKNNTQKNNKKKITWRELNVTDYPFVETGDKGDSESGFRCSGKEILLFKRTEMYFIQAKLIFSSTPPPFSATDFQEGFGAGAGAGENKLPRLSRIFFNQVVLLLRIEHLEFNSVKDDVTAA